MINADIARKLTHLHIKKALGKISPTDHKGTVTRLGRKHKYPREVGMVAKQAARSVMDIVKDYSKLDYVEVNRYADTLIVSDSELHLIRLDFEATSRDAAYNVQDDKELWAEARFAYQEVKDLYPIKTVVRTTINTNIGLSGTIAEPINIFIKGE